MKESTVKLRKIGKVKRRWWQRYRCKQSKRPAQHFECTKKVFHNPIYTHVLAIIGNSQTEQMRKRMMMNSSAKMKKIGEVKKEVVRKRLLKRRIQTYPALPVQKKRYVTKIIIPMHLLKLKTHR